MPVADLRMEEQDPAGIRPFFPQFVSVLRTMWEPEAWPLDSSWSCDYSSRSIPSHECSRQYNR